MPNPSLQYVELYRLKKFVKPLISSLVFEMTDPRDSTAATATTGEDSMAVNENLLQALVLLFPHTQLAGLRVNTEVVR